MSDKQKYWLRKKKRQLARWILAKLGFNQRVRLYNQYWNRWDWVDLAEFVTTNHQEQQAIRVTLESGDKTFIQPSHYCKYK